jgi:hypothetical protein
MQTTKQTLLRANLHSRNLIIILFRIRVRRSVVPFSPFQRLEMLVGERRVEFEAGDFRLFILRRGPWPFLFLLVLWQRRVVPVGAHATLKHASGLADFSLLL